MSYQPEKLTPWVLLSGTKKFHFFVESGVFIVLHKETSVGFLVDPQSLTPNLMTQKLAEAVNLLKCANPDNIKLIGNLALIEKLKDFFPGIASRKIIEKEAPFELLFYPEENRTAIANPAKSHLPTETNPKKLQPKFARGPIRVLIVDDSKPIRILLRRILTNHNQIQIVGDTGDPEEVMPLLAKLKPDVITLDIHMPKMDGVTLLKKYIPEFPIPTVMISSTTMEEGNSVLTALENGAVDYINKPNVGELIETSEAIIDTVLSAANARVTVRRAVKKQLVQLRGHLNQDTLIAIGASTGGTEALRELLCQLPSEIPPILIVQHIPAGFSGAFAKRLNELCPFEVIEAKNGDEIRKNRVLIAPGGKQMRPVWRAGLGHIVIEDSPPVNRHKPSVDFLFNCLAEERITNAVGVILTGMGGDGAAGLLKLKNKGWATIAQDKESCVVFGMPAVAIDLGAAEHICSLNEIPQRILQLLPSKKVG